MGIKELREKYGANAKGRVAINRAIRAELPGGNALLDLIELLLNADRDDDPVIADIRDLALQAQQDMSDEIARRYNLKSSG